jgi:predicted membrane channel-forming protein YqfA (hemolysin III family)
MHLSLEVVFILVGMAGLIILPFLCKFLHLSWWWMLVPLIIFIIGAVPFIVFILAMRRMH